MGYMEKIKKNKFLKRIVYCYRTYNAPIDKIIKNYPLLRQYKNKYKGKRCFVIGNGPSLNVGDLEKLNNEYTFAANKIYTIFEKTKWRPTFYCVQDIPLATNMGINMIPAFESCDATFVRMQAYKTIRQFYNKYNLILVPIYHSFFVNKNYAFSKKADRFIYDGNTVTYMSIELAAYMGFSEIYLLGVDHNYPILRDNSGKVTVDKTVAAHFYETADDNYGDDSKHFKSAAIELVTKMYETAEKYSRDFGSFRIYNATRGGKLEVFERVEFDSLF